MLRKIFLNDKVIFAVILLNSLMIFLQESGIDSVVVDTIDAVSTVFFLVEMITKLHIWGVRKYWRDGWNCLDGVLVILSLPSLMVYAFPNIGMNISFLLALRLLRVFRFFRMLHLFPNFSRIVQNIRVAFRESLSIFVGLFILIVITSMINCALFRDVAPEYFSSPLDSMYAIFQICTIEGWYDIPNSITVGMSLWMTFLVRAYFIIVLVMLGFIGMSIVNSIFVDAMVSDNNDEVIRRLDAITKDIHDLKDKLQ